MMDRRSFVKFIALMAAGTAALPEQIETFTNYYEINTPPGNGPFLAVDEIFVGGTASQSMPTILKISRGENCLLNLGFNAFGGVIRWVAMADSKIIARPKELCWKFHHNHPVGDWPMTGQISYIGSNGIRHYQPLNSERGQI